MREISNGLRERFRGIAFGCAFIASVFVMTTTAQANTDREIIRKRLLQDVYDSVPHAQRGTWMVKEIDQWKKTIKPDGSYSDVDYVSTLKPNWGLLDNLGRALVYVMAARLEGHPYYKHAEMDRLALRSIHFAASREWDHINWWHKEIGLPLQTYKLLLLFADKMPSKDRDYVMALTRKSHLVDHPSHWAARGQNLIWYSTLTIALGVLYDRTDWFKLSKDAITTEIGFDHQQGIKEDYSFFQHGDLFYSGGYGLGFASDAAKLMALLQGTSYQFAESTYNTLSSYILDGELWLIHHKVMDHSSSGRYYARFGGGDSKGLQPACHFMAAVNGPRMNEFKRCELTLKDGSEPGAQGNKMFWMADFMTHNRPQFGISVRMFSKRTVNGDTSPLGEGLKSHHLSDGLTYFYRTGEEYWDIFGILDFKRLPGTTEEHMDVYPAVPKNDYWPDYGPSSFVGGVSDGTNGASTMDFQQRELSAKKSWFFHEKGMVALGAAVTCKTCRHPITSINQEWSKGELKQGAEPRTRQVWVHANHMGYLIPDDLNLVVQDKIQEGNWKSIDVNKKDEVVKGKITSLWIEHGAKVHNGTYAYSVYPEVSESQIQELSRKPDFTVVANSASTQAVLFPGENMIQSVFHQKGTVEWDNENSWIKVSHHCVVQLREINGKLFLSAASPDREISRLKVEYSWKGKTGEQTIHFKKGNYAGDSVTVAL